MEHNLGLSAIYIGLENLVKKNKIQGQIFRTLSPNTTSHIPNYEVRPVAYIAKLQPFVLCLPPLFPLYHMVV